MSQFARGAFIGLLVFFIVDAYGQSQDSIQQSDSTILKPGITEIKSGTIQTLPFRTSGDLLLFGPNTYYLKGGRYFSDGLEAVDGSVFIDGMQIGRGNDFLLRSIKDHKHYRSNQPIQYGDVAGSMSVIRTRSFNDSLHIEADILTSVQNHYDNLVFELLVGGPIRFNRKENRLWEKAPSFMIGAEFSGTSDPNPSWEDKFQTQQNTMDFLTQTPYRKWNDNYGGTLLNSDFTSQYDYQQIEAHQNADRTSRKVFGKIEIPVSDKMELTTGAYFNYNDGREFIFDNALYNSQNNPATIIRNIDTYINWKHEILSTSELKVSYNAHFQYSNYYFQRESERHEDRWFDYGYLGKFKTYKTQSYERGDIEINGIVYHNVNLLNSWDNDTAYTFQSLDYNPETARFTEIIYELFPEKESADGSVGYWRNQDELTGNGGLLNGMAPQNVYGLWSSQGDNTPPPLDMGLHSFSTLYGESKQDKYRGIFQFDVQYKKHNFKMGFEYSQKVESSYGINPNRLWSRMRTFTNFHITELDLDNPILIYGDDGTFSDTVLFYRRYYEESQFQFDKSLREKLGLAVDGLDFILTDSYDKINNTIDYYDKDGVMHTISTPENLLSIDMFDPMELVGDRMLKYRGYTYDGYKMKSNSDPYSFYSDGPINAFKPVYSSFFVEDDFVIGNFSARVGVRFDYYDANQPMMKDKYTLSEAYTVGEMDGLEGQPVSHPENIGDDYVVYVNDSYNTTRIMGYRNEDTWFNEDGEEIYDPEELNAGSGVSPYLKYPNIQFGDEDWKPDMTFKDYDPVVSLLPQVNLNYKFWRMNTYISLNSFSKNPYALHHFNPEDYLMFYNTSLIENPGLKPYRVYKFNVGANLQVYKSLFFDLSYQNMQVFDYFVLERISGAYPRSYNSSANLSRDIIVYSFTPTLFFIPSSASGFNGKVSVTYSYMDENLKSILNISDFVLNSSIAYNFGYDREFTFPSSKIMKAIFEGFNISLYYQTRAGTYLPRTTYSPQNYNYSPDFSILNLRLEKGFFVGPANTYISAYFLVENLLNKENVYYIDPTTGAVNDDGYLSAPEWEHEIEQQNDPDSYRLQYQMKLINPAYYAKPRIMRLGFIVKI